jgi:hypothetical protein
MAIEEPYNELILPGTAVILDNTESIIQSMMKYESESGDERHDNELHRSSEGYFFFQHAFIYNKRWNQTRRKKIDRMLV